MAVYDLAPDQQKNEVIKAHDHGDFIHHAFDRIREGRSFNPIEDPSATEQLIEQVREWQSEDKVVAMTFGCFDAPFHPNHQRFLLECKLQGVVEYYNRFFSNQLNEPWQELDFESRHEFANAALSDGAVKMVVSMDGDQRVAHSKGFSANKGNSSRPLLGWDTRTGNVLGLSLPLNHDPNLRVPVVDAVTIHDQYALPGTMHSSTPDMVAGVDPDVWSLFYEAESDIETATSDPRFKNTTIAVIDGAAGYHVNDPITGKAFSTTSLVNRIKGVR